MSSTVQKKRWQPKAVLISLLVLIVAAGAVLLWVGSKSSEETLMVDKAITRSPLLMQVSETRFRVSKGSEVTITVISNSAQTGEVIVSDENGETLLTLDLIDGKAVGSIGVFEEEPRCIRLTASMGEEESLPVNLYVSPEITADMIVTGMNVAGDLGEMLAAQGFEDITTEALAMAETWLRNDPRVDAVVPMDNGVFYYTTDGIAGACMLTPEEDMFGSSLFSQEESDALAAYSAWEAGEENTYRYIWSDNTLTNDRIMVLRPRYQGNLTGKELMSRKMKDACVQHETPAQVANLLAQELNVASPEIYDDKPAVDKIMEGDMNEYGIILINTHGWVIGPNGMPLEDRLFTMQLHKAKVFEEMKETYSSYEAYLQKEMGIDKGSYSDFFTRYTEDAEKNIGTCMLFMDVDGGTASALKELKEKEQKGDNTPLEKSVVLCGTANLLYSQYQNKMFDNSVLYWGVCNSMTNKSMAKFFVDHGVVACIGYEGAVVKSNESVSCYSFFKGLLKKHATEPRTVNVEESCENNNIVLHEIRRFFEWVIPVTNYYLFMDENPDQHNMNTVAYPADYTLSGTGTLTGTVQMDQTGEPVGGALVEIYHWLDQEFILVGSTSTTGTGSFRMADIPWGVYVIKVTSEEGDPAYADCILAAEEWNGGTIRINGLSSYYEYIRDELEPKLGLFQQGELKMSINDLNAQGWDERTGILSAAIQDMNADGIDDMVMLRVEQEDRKGWNLQALYADMYTMEKGKVVLKDSVKLNMFNNSEIHELWVAMYEAENRVDLFVQSYSEGVLVPGTDPIYSRYRFDGEALRKVFSIEQTGGGTTEKVYSDTVYNPETGKEDSSALWVDMMIWDFIGSGLYNSWGYQDVPSMYWHYVEDKMGMKAPAAMYDYPSYVDAQKFVPVAVFRNTGVPVGGLGGDFTMSIWDQSNLSAALEALGK